MSAGLRMHVQCDLTNPIHGTVVWSPVKSIWYSSMLLVAGIAGPLTYDFRIALVSGLLTAATLCFGHSVGLHRLLIHRSFKCPLWLEYCMVYCGVLVGMGGPRKMLYMHDIRDWSQRQSQCHAFYIHATPIWKDWIWNLHCELQLEHPPEFKPEARVTESRFYGFMDRHWIAVQLPLAIILLVVGGIPMVVWGICVRVALSLTGHWLVGYIAHHWGRQTWLVDGASVQGYNVHGLGLITMGEAWHNNHHAFPESARLGLDRGQWDAGWWLLCCLKRLGLVWNLQLPGDLPKRPELRRKQLVPGRTKQPASRIAVNPLNWHRASKN